MFPHHTSQNKRSSRVVPQYSADIEQEMSLYCQDGGSELVMGYSANHHVDNSWIQRQPTDFPEDLPQDFPQDLPQEQEMNSFKSQRANSISQNSKFQKEAGGMSSYSNADDERPIGLCTFLGQFYSPINILRGIHRHLQDSDEYSPFFARPEVCDAYSRRERLMVLVNVVLVSLTNSAFLMTVQLPTEWYAKKMMGALLNPILKALMLTELLKRIFKAKADEGGCCMRCLRKSGNLLAVALWAISCFFGVTFIADAFYCKQYVFSQPQLVAQAMSSQMLAPAGSSKGTIIFVCESKTQMEAANFCAKLGGRLPLYNQSSEYQMATKIMNQHLPRFGIATFGLNAWAAGGQPGAGRLTCMTATWNSATTKPTLINNQNCSTLLQFGCLVDRAPSFAAELDNCRCTTETKTLVETLLIQYIINYFIGNLSSYIYSMLLAPVYFLLVGMGCCKFTKFLLDNLVLDWARSDASGRPAIRKEDEYLFFTLIVWSDAPRNMCCCGETPEQETCSEERYD
ncbi:hypothetical protein GUITHDRAFT_113121 [Guillardia theta CCMP2712]|uniref:C-type lectin domain-containing protein n=1 Tax=Guillardia theta (strain CCMP2712) TaxID=905079 RepID=L1IYG2_GUITC|nr:hypothetical protein GUITHDRAFT_113121 [Guillardia theta CCMP2712]EKX40860.1 hypothetical protein GUITHDRAFT_113121 [Guillardia theta CCMP2712]|eukprot:XP_005827840.1 hypothetical protein GUITHDRAFT_113121 [Guillardia theta CCMP2712]